MGGAIAAGHKNTLHRYERKALTLAREACDKLGEDHPAVIRHFAILEGIAGALPGYRGRYVGVRLQASCRTLEWLIGKAIQPIAHSGKIGFTLTELLGGKPDAPPDSAE